MNSLEGLTFGTEVSIIRPKFIELKGNLLSQPNSPFDTIESTQEFLQLFDEAVADTLADVARDLADAEAQKDDRKLVALRLVTWKLEKLDLHLSRSRRLLNDLRTLRRLLFREREMEDATEDDPAQTLAACSD